MSGSPDALRTYVNVIVTATGTRKRSWVGSGRKGMPPRTHARNGGPARRGACVRTWRSQATAGRGALDHAPGVTGRHGDHERPAAGGRERETT